MGQGRPAKSRQEKVLQGTLRKDRERRAETLPASSGKFGLPIGLSKTVQRHCSNMAKYLKDAGIPIDLARPMFDRYCKCLQLASTAYENMDTDKGAARVWKENNDAALKIEKQFEVLLRKARPPEVKEDQLKDFQAAGKKLQAVK